MPLRGGTGRFLRGLVTVDELEARVFDYWRGFTRRGRSTRSFVSRAGVYGRRSELSPLGLAGRGSKACKVWSLKERKKTRRAAAVG
jgi:hypothetical protein